MPSSDVLGAPLEELEFLARSPNRVSVLDALTRGPIGRYELEETAGVTRATLGRILDDFQDRGWVTEGDRQYETTQLGAYVSREIMAALSGFEPVPALSEVVQWFPEEGFDFVVALHPAGEQWHTVARIRLVAPERGTPVYREVPVQMCGRHT